MNALKRKEWTEKIVLLVPLFIAFVWMGFLVVNVQAPESDLRMAPSRLDSLINALFAFIILYAIVLFVIFIRLNRQVKQQSKKSKKKK